jgi:meso-butanediol dehydrogenase/(S,S)-butanediol dehydrogenase/diacetyl reductase
VGRFTDRVVIVTGAGSGIGAATADRFADEGAHVVLAGRTEEKLDGVLAGTTAQERMSTRVTDVADPDAVRGLIEETVQAHGRLDVLVNNAGRAGGGRVVDEDPETWHAVFATNVDSVFHACRHAIPHLIRTGGSIVNVASVSGLGADWSNVSYNASKGALVNMSRAMALDHAKDGVRINTVCPSLTITDMTTGIQGDEERLAKFRDRIAMGRPADASEVASVIAFLASADASFVTGIELPVDGGLGASNGQPTISPVAGDRGYRAAPG